MRLTILLLVRYDRTAANSLIMRVRVCVHKTNHRLLPTFIVFNTHITHSKLDGNARSLRIAFAVKSIFISINYNEI